MPTQINSIGTFIAKIKNFTKAYLKFRLNKIKF
jgi:hypothetical protein